jgi:hypothetical protein
MYRNGPAGHGVVLHGVPEGRHHVLGHEPVEGLDQAEHAVHGDEEEEHDPVEQVQPGDLLPVGPQARVRRGSRASGRQRRHRPFSFFCSPRRPRRGGELLLPCAAAAPGRRPPCSVAILHCFPFVIGRKLVLSWEVLAFQKKNKERKRKTGRCREVVDFSLGRWSRLLTCHSPRRFLCWFVEAGRKQRAGCVWSS